jgi:hypothetical protein
MGVYVLGPNLGAQSRPRLRHRVHPVRSGRISHFIFNRLHSWPSMIRHAMLIVGTNIQARGFLPG